MANALYPSFKAAMLSPGVDLVNGLIGSGSGSTYPASAPLKAVLLAGYTYSSGHSHLSDVASYVVGSAVALSGQAIVASGTEESLNANSVTFSSVATGSTVTSMALYMDTGSSSTARLIEYVDTLSGGTTLNITTNGGNITINWDTGVNKIFGIN